MCAAQHSNVYLVTELLKEPNIDFEREINRNSLYTIAHIMAKRYIPSNSDLMNPKEKQANSAIIHKFFSKRIKTETPDWVCPLFDPWYDKDPELWCESDGF